MNNHELINTIGGASSITTLMNSVAKIGNLLLEVGRAIGSAVRYVKTGKQC